MRQDHFAGGQAVSVYRFGKTTQEVQEPFKVALRMVEPPRTGPAIGSGKNAFVAMGIDHAA